MVSTGTIGAPAGDPLAGFQSRGIPMPPPTSNLPQPRSFPVGSRLRCRGTMSQPTTGPHLPVVASAGNAETLTGAAVTVSASMANSRVCAPVPLMPRSPNFAKPDASVVAVTVPSSVPPPEAMRAVTSAPAAGCPLPSFTCTSGCTAGSNTSPVSAEVGGLFVSAIVDGAAVSAIVDDVICV